MQDNACALPDMLKSLADNSNGRKRLGMANKHIVKQQFSIQLMLRKLEQELKEVRSV